ncbi:MAG: DNA-directed RNA polymerase subunit omega [Spirochaetales bacterium]|nr:DNA-directed RNA polymerase subunit omega [Spirochaetales bacterium]
MSIPLENLTLYSDNKYAMTTAVIKRAKHIAEGYASDSEDAANGKIVSAAMDEILTGKIKFTNDDEE